MIESTPQKRTLTSEQIQQQTEEFLARGGKITRLDTGIPCTDLDYRDYVRRVQRQEIANSRGYRTSLTKTKQLN